MPEPTLSITALYTAHAWSWAAFPHAHLLIDHHTRTAFRLTNAIVDFARWWRPDAPSLRHSLAQRHQVIDALTVGLAHGQVVELACGLSPRCLTLSADPATRCLEVDLPHVIDHKRQRLLTTPEGRAALDRPNLQLLAGDVRTLDLSTWLDPNLPVTVTAEGLLMYFDGQTRRAVWSRIAEALTHPDSRLIFDLTPPAEEPRPGRWGRLLGWLMRRATAGHDVVQDERTREEVRNELIAAGLEVEAVYDPTCPPDGLKLGWSEEPTWFVVWCCRRAIAGSAGTGAPNATSPELDP